MKKTNAYGETKLLPDLDRTFFGKVNKLVTVLSLLLLKVREKSRDNNIYFHSVYSKVTATNWA